MRENWHFLEEALSTQEKKKNTWTESRILT